MTAGLRAALPTAGVLVLLFFAGGAEAACVALPDGSGGARVQCDDGSAGRLRPDGLGGMKGMVGKEPARLRAMPGSPPESRSMPAAGGGASGRGSRQGANGKVVNPCLSGGLMKTNCR